jgi:hypothetical protein
MSDSTYAIEVLDDSEDQSHLVSGRIPPPPPPSPSRESSEEEDDENKENRDPNITVCLYRQPVLQFINQYTGFIERYY